MIKMENGKNQTEFGKNNIFPIDPVFWNKLASHEKEKSELVQVF